MNLHKKPFEVIQTFYVCFLDDSCRDNPSKINIQETPEQIQNMLEGKHSPPGLMNVLG